MSQNKKITSQERNFCKIRIARSASLVGGRDEALELSIILRSVEQVGRVATDMCEVHETSMCDLLSSSRAGTF